LPPDRYVYIALALVGLFILSFKATMGFSIILFYVLFLAAASLLALGGIFRCGIALGAPKWVTFGLMSPLLVEIVGFLTLRWGGSGLQLYRLMALIGPACRVASGVAAVRIIEIVYMRSRLTVAAYLILAALFVVDVARNLPVASLSETLRNFAGASWYHVVSVVDAGVYGAIFASAALVVFTFREIEFWIVVAIGAVGLEQVAYVALIPGPAPFALGGMQLTGILIWLKPVFLLIGAAALWRAGAMLHAESRLRALRNASYGR
jgi:hypothetical protein